MNDTNRAGSEFEVNVRKKGDTFFLHVPEWRLLVEGTDLNEAYNNLQNQQQAIVRRYREAGLQHELPQPVASPHNKQLLRDGSRTIVKTVIVGAVVGMFLLLPSMLLVHQLQSFQSRAQQWIKEVDSPSPAALGKIATGVFVKTAQTMEQMTPVRKEEVRESIRIIVQEMLPYAREFRPPVGELINQGLAKN